MEHEEIVVNKPVSIENTIANIQPQQIPENAAHREELWFFFDRRQPYTEAKRLYFPNAAMAERFVRTMLNQNPECKACPKDFFIKRFAIVGFAEFEYQIELSHPEDTILEFENYV